MKYFKGKNLDVYKFYTIKHNKKYKYNSSFIGF